MAGADRPIRVALADDHAVVREGLGTLLGREPDLAVVGEAGDGAAALRLFAQLAPDVLVLDLGLPVLGGEQVVRRLARDGAAGRVLVLSAAGDPATAGVLLGQGVGGYLLKEEPTATFLAAVRGVARGQTGWVSPALTARLLARAATGPAGLDERACRLLRLLEAGHSNKEIAAMLGLAEKTVRNRASALYQDIEVRNRAAAGAWARAHGLGGGEEGEPGTRDV